MIDDIESFANFMSIMVPIIIILFSIGGIIWYYRIRDAKRIARMILDGKKSPSSPEGFDRLLNDLASRAKKDIECEYLWHKLMEKREALIQKGGKATR